MKKVLLFLLLNTIITFNSYALTVRGQAPQGFNTIHLETEIYATSKLPGCMHFNVMGPIFNGGEPRGWNMNKKTVLEESVNIKNGGQYFIESKNLQQKESSRCDYEIYVVSIVLTGADGEESEVYLGEGDSAATEFTLSLGDYAPISQKYFDSDYVINIIE